MCQWQNRRKLCLVTKRQARDLNAAQAKQVKTHFFVLPGPSQVFSGEAMARLGQPPALSPHGEPRAPEPALRLGALQGEQLYRQCQEPGASSPGSLPLPVLPGPGDGGLYSCFLLYSSRQVLAGPTVLFLGESRLLRARSPSAQPLPWRRWLFVSLLWINMCKHCISQMAFAEGGGAWMFEEGFSSIITWTAGVPDPEWLNIYRQAEQLGNTAHGVPSPQPDPSVQFQLHSHRCLCCSVEPSVLLLASRGMTPEVCFLTLLL